MSTFVISFVLVLLAFAAMAVGVLLGRAPISGSCGGLGSGGACRLCLRGCARRAVGQPEKSERQPSLQDE